MSVPITINSSPPAPRTAEPRLTSLSHGGGCGCKIAPSVLAELLKGSPPIGHYADLLVGTDTSDANSGDALILGKPLGVGIFSAAFKKGLLDDEGYRALIETATQLNVPGMELSNLAGVHAITDVAGFGLLGHLLEMCRGSALAAHITAKDLPLLRGLLDLVKAGIATGASARNRQSYGKDVRLATHLDAALQAVLTDPQTSGGLLVACDPGASPDVQSIFARLGFAPAAVIGRMSDGEPQAYVE